MVGWWGVTQTWWSLGLDVIVKSGGYRDRQDLTDGGVLLLQVDNN